METRRSADLVPHPKNATIYGDGADKDFVESVREKGVLVPLLIAWDNRVIGGHRRLDAARKAGLEVVPVVVFSSRDELDIIAALIESNRQRQKTKEQLAREAKELLDVEKERAQRRQQQHANTAPGRRKETLVEPVPQVSGDAGKARDKVGEKLGISGKTAERAAVVVEEIDRLEEEGEQEEAEGLRKTLNEDGVKPAFEKVKPASKPDPRHPHSDTLTHWLKHVTGQSIFIDTPPPSGLGGIAALLAEPAKWDWRQVGEFILPMLEAHAATVDHYKKEITNAYRQRNGS